ncbi:MAG: NADH-quinone oxidoreductase subunit C [Chloroflexi bacterium]|nr:NADH-quinone oxidoreductase subunit C [Chloroflexota bacterium]MCZ6891460.1 NADH-quinone oxidoreductase subunit C [Chloroflexota bacterium]
MASEKPRHQPEPAKAEPALDEKGQALAALLKKSLKEFQPEIGASLDEVVVTVRPELVVEVGRKLKDDPETACDFLRCLSVVDYEDRFQVVYHLYSLDKNHHLVVKSDLPYEDPHIPSMISVWPGADWYEREGHDLFGVVFDGHPNLEPLILYEGFEGYPGRKSYPINDYREW